MRKVLIAIVLTMASVAIISSFVGTGVAADFPAIVLAPTSDAALDSTLAAAMNAGELKRLHAEQNQQVSGASLVAAEERRLEEIMRGMGYLDARIEVTGNVDRDPSAEIVFKPKPGPLYRVGLVEVDGLGKVAQSVRDDVAHQMAAAAGKAASGNALALLEDEVLWRIRSASYPLATVAGRDLSQMPGTALARVRIEVVPGDIANFGAVTYSGMVGLKKDELVRLQPFQQGEAFSPRVLERFREALVAHPAIRAARVSLADKVDGNGEVQVKVQIEEEQVGVADDTGIYRFVFAAMISGVAMIAIRQIWIAALPVGRARWPWWLEAITILVLAVAFFMGTHRLLLLAVPG
ncbi:hypothetical protein [Ensifer sp. MJa1]|uniref:hypothetical protein n=1 Tax=Ensifer sp. MJa1 TaxID=2919888 RepID=UPI003008EEEB